MDQVSQRHCTDVQQGADSTSEYDSCLNCQRNCSRRPSPATRPSATALLVLLTITLCSVSITLTPCMAAPLSDSNIHLPAVTYHYHFVNWTPCSGSCGAGVQSPIIKCQRGVGSVDDWENMVFDIVDDQYCVLAGKVKPVIQTTRPCRLKPCMPNSWVKGHWSQCNASCSGGYRRRPIMCYNPNTMRSEPASECRKPIPRHLQRCNTSPCDGQWMVGKWNNCSTSCGIGVHQRRVVCRSSSGVIVSSQSSRSAISEPSGCRYLIQPPRTQLCCNSSGCPADKQNICTSPPASTSPGSTTPS
eukprot:scpid65631/ scgid21363/ A disintegrin and metalloproteinase with thrombospondin motifs 10